MSWRTIRKLSKEALMNEDHLGAGKAGGDCAMTKKTMMLIVMLMVVLMLMSVDLSSLVSSCEQISQDLNWTENDIEADDDLCSSIFSDRNFFWSHFDEIEMSSEK